MPDGPTRPPRPILAVVFDLDGTMFDTEALFFVVASEMLEARGKVFTPAIMRAMIGRQPSDSALALKTMSGLDDPPDVLMAEAKARFLARLADVRPMPGLMTILDRLRDLGLPLAVATSSGREYANGLLVDHGVRDRFRAVLTREDVVHHKPDPEIYRTAAALLGADVAATLVIEDTPTGLAAARAAGTFAVGIPHAYSPIEDLGAASMLARSLDDTDLLGLFDPPPPPGGPDR